MPMNLSLGVNLGAGGSAFVPSFAATGSTAGTAYAYAPVIRDRTVSASAPTRIWNYVLTTEMRTALGSGQVGPFWTV